MPDVGLGVSLACFVPWRAEVRRTLSVTRLEPCRLLPCSRVTPLPSLSAIRKRYRNLPDERIRRLARDPEALTPEVQIECSRREGTEETWQEVELADGSPGYVACEHVGMAVDYRMTFEKEDGEWVITFIGAGD